MQINTQISAEDHREFANAVDGVSRQKRAAGRASVILVAVSLFLILAVVGFTVSLARLTYHGSLDVLLNSPVLVVLIVIGLLLLPVAFAWLRGSSRLRRNLKAAAAGEIDETCLRDGLNIGVARFELDDDSFHVTFELVQETLPWSMFQTLRETKGLLCLMIDKGSGYIVPKRAFDSNEALRDFKAMVTLRTGVAT